MEGIKGVGLGLTVGIGYQLIALMKLKVKC